MDGELQEKPKRIISVRHLRKVYRIGDERVVALSDINIEIYLGQIICIVGTSGSGKSTLLNQLAGLEKPTKGAVFIGKTNISRLNENKLALFRQRYLGFVFQSYNLLATMSALENVELPMIFKGVSRYKRKKAAMAMLAAVGLKKRAHHRPTQMSGGQQQRVGIARAFVTRPKVIFADEPTGNLDTKTTIAVMKMMVRFARKYHETLILVTHDPELADYADRVITLIDGEIKSDVSHTPIYDGSETDFRAPDEPVSSHGGKTAKEAKAPPTEAPAPLSLAKEPLELHTKNEETGLGTATEGNSLPDTAASFPQKQSGTSETILSVGREKNPAIENRAETGQEMDLLAQMLADTAPAPDEAILPAPDELPELPDDIDLPDESDFENGQDTDDREPACSKGDQKK